MEYKNFNYETKRISLNHNSNNYQEMYSGFSSAEIMYNNIVKYIPNTTHTGNYIPLK